MPTFRIFSFNRRILISVLYILTRLRNMMYARVTDSEMIKEILKLKSYHVWPNFIHM